ncbi:hypothetical protein [Streptomyces chrestomyceticus]|uniref:hypothetical protein n=1 Tax=Streptomyces chrestomyceticus TaxID=68185 RepID=UPI0033F3986A
MQHTSTEPATHDVTAVLDATLAVMTVRGYYQPTSRQWEEMVPTAFEVFAYLCGRSYTGEPHMLTRFNLAAYDPAEAADIITWARAGADEADDYRRSLAAAVRTGRVRSQDLPLVCSAAHAWRRAQQRRNAAADRAADAANSRPQGAKGERIARTVTVAAVITLGTRTYGYHEITKYLVKLRDDSHNVYVWPTTSRTKRLPARGARITVRGTVTAHEDYQGTAQTYLTRVAWKLGNTTN